jgi:peptide/nickel transport system permease protein
MRVESTPVNILLRDERLLRRLWRQLLTDSAGFAGVVGLSLLLAFWIVGPLVVGHDPLAQVSRPLSLPSWSHWLGTDEVGRDVLARVLAGTGPAIYTAIGAAIFAFAAGTPLGLVAGFRGGVIDAFLMRICDFIMSLPPILAALIVIVILGPGTGPLLIALGFGSIPAFARLARAGTLAMRDRAFVRAGRTMGAGPADLMFVTILPNILGPLLVQVTVTASASVVATAALSFLGLGLTPPTPSWGGMLQASRSYWHQAPLYGLAAGVALTLTIATFDCLSRAFQRIVGSRSVANSKSTMVV